MVNHPLRFLTYASVLFFVLTALAGCASPSPDSLADAEGLPPRNPNANQHPFDPYVRTWGLGLQIPPEPPEPAPYVEDAAELAELENFIDNYGQELLDGCPYPGNYSYIRQSIGEDYLNIIFSMLNECGFSRAAQEAPNEAEKAFNNKTYLDRYDELRANAIDSIHQTDEEWQVKAKPGTIVQLEVYMILLRARSYADALISISEEYYRQTIEMANNGANDEDIVNGLHLAFANAMFAQTNSDALYRFINAYPWDGGTCEGDKSIDYFQLAGEKINQLISTARQKEEFGYEGRIELNLEDDLKKDYEYFLAIDEPFGALYSLMEAIWITEYYTLFESRKLPTVEEAQYLIALHRSEQRDLLTEKFSMELKQAVDAADPEYTWSHLPAIRTLALQELKFPLDNVQCAQGSVNQ